MKIIFAQGNPGSEFTSTRHNVGFDFIERLASTKNTTFASKVKFFAEIAEATIQDEKVLLVKPTTYYNETGRSARALVDFYKLDPETDFLVIHDDLALPFGTIRTRPSGSDAGNNGIKSLNAHLGDHYSRIRVGIYNDLRDRIPDADFVLAKFTSGEAEQLPQLFTHTEQFIDAFVQGDLPSTKVTI
jgi:peptidyl-tRNA hydrolase, PTH1 family